MVILAFSKAPRQGKLPSSLPFVTHPFERHTFPTAAVRGFIHTLICGAGGTSYLITFWQILPVSVVCFITSAALSMKSGFKEVRTLYSIPGFPGKPVLDGTLFQLQIHTHQYALLLPRRHMHAHAHTSFRAMTLSEALPETQLSTQAA